MNQGRVHSGLSKILNFHKIFAGAMIQQPGIQYHNFQISIFYKFQFKSNYYFSFHLSQFISIFYFQNFQEASKIDFKCFNNIWNPGPSLEPLILQKPPLKNLILTSLERSLSRIAIKKFAAFLFVCFLSYWGSKMLSCSKF